MEALADKHALHDTSADEKIKEVVRKLDLSTLSEKDFVRDLGHMITSARTDCSCKVAMGLTCCWTNYLSLCSGCVGWLDLPLLCL